MTTRSRTLAILIAYVLLALASPLIALLLIGRYVYRRMKGPSSLGSITMQTIYLVVVELAIAFIVIVILYGLKLI